MYQAGDLIVYGGMGVCRVVGTEPQQAPDGTGEQLFYTLEPLGQACVIRTPAENPRVFMRPIVTKKEAEHLIDRIPGISPKAFHSRVTSELTEHYKSALRTHDCGDLVELTMSIHKKKQLAVQEKRKFGFVDEKFMKLAEELLYGELGAALGIPPATVPAYIEDRVGTTVQAT